MKAKPPKEKGGSTENARRLKSNTESLRDEVSPADAYGTHQLCAWKVGPGQFWFQTTRSNFARKLAKRGDARRVEVVGLNHYRQTFEILGTRRKVERIIRRYLASTPDQFSARVVAEKPLKIIPRVGDSGRNRKERIMSREEIIAGNPIVDFVRSRGHELKPAGQNFVTNGCPQTQHKHGHRPVMIYPETQSWSCHDCKRGGSVIDWVMHEAERHRR